MDLGIIDVVQRTLLVNGEWDRPVARVLDLYLEPGKTFLDVGANVGYFTLYASKLVGSSGRVVAFEPSIRALTQLLTNLNLNDCSNVVLFSVAAGERESIETLYRATPNNIGATSLRPLAGSVTETIAVLSIDDLFSNLRIAPDLVKIDTEGYELSVLRGMSRVLNERSPEVVCEITHGFLRELGSSASELISFMRGRGYECYGLMDVEELAGYRISDEMVPELPPQLDALFTTRAPRFKVVESPVAR